jgi:hypothetical protein
VTYDTSDPTAIERELAETRARLDARLGQLEKRLSPGRLVDDGLDYLRHGQGAAFARNLGAELRDNPLPVAVTGIGLTWLMAVSALSSKGKATATGDLYDNVAARARRAGESVTRFTNETEEDFQTRIAAARAQILGVQRQVSETASAFTDRVTQAFDTAQQSARERLEQMQQTAHEWGETVFDQTRRTGEAINQAAQQGRQMVSHATSNIIDTVNENPLLLGALGLTAGVLLAALLPATEQEEALAAPLAGAVQRAADDVIDRGKRAAEAAYETFTEPG